MGQNQLLLQFDTAQVKQKINECDNICIFSHRNPDGDALGSSLALYHYFLGLGKKVHVILPNSFPDFLSWMPGSSDIKFVENNKQEIDGLIEQAGLMFFLDFNSHTRISEMADAIGKSEAYKIHIDHHPSPDISADITISYTNVSSTAELMYWFFNALDLTDRLNKSIATCLYVGILTDTGCFNHNISSKTTFYVASELMGCNIDNQNIYYNIYDNFSFQRMQLLGYCLQNKMEYFPELNTAFIAITAEELNRYNYQVGDTEGFVNYPLSIKGVRFSALFTEKDNQVKISLRSKGNFAVNKFSANHFNGGGHLNAAGGNSKLSMDETLEKFRALLNNYTDELSD